MCLNRLKILQHVLKILEIETEIHKILISEEVKSVNSLIHTKHETYQLPVDKPIYNFSEHT